MRRPRRRTLSHSEIENFLTEISASENKLNTAAPTKGDCDVVKPAAVSVITSQADSQIIENALPVEVATESTIRPSIPAEVDLIRRFCKAKFQGAMHETVEQVQIAREILSLSEYKLLSTRLLFPEQFPHPSTSIESKKALLISLSPMLTDAEEQRKRDSRACEEFTRCKSTKGRGRSNYEYIDVDTNFTVDFDEFEKRYHMFINRHKSPTQPQEEPEEEIVFSAEELPMEEDSVSLTLSHTASESVTVVTESETHTQDSLTLTHTETTTTTTTTHGETHIDSTTVSMSAFEDSALSIDESDFSFTRRTEKRQRGGGGGGDRKRKHNAVANNDRRGTLSPASARAMLLDAVEDEEQRERETATERDAHTETESDLCESNNVSVCGAHTPESAAETRRGKRKTQRETPSWLRRHTLSPSSARTIALELLETERERERDRETETVVCEEVVVCDNVCVSVSVSESDSVCDSVSVSEIESCVSEMVCVEGVSECVVESECVQNERETNTETHTETHTETNTPTEACDCALSEYMSMNVCTPQCCESESRDASLPQTHALTESDRETRVLATQLDDLLCDNEEETTSAESDNERESKGETERDTHAGCGEREMESKTVLQECESESLCESVPESEIETRTESDSSESGECVTMTDSEGECEMNCESISHNESGSAVVCETLTEKEREPPSECEETQRVELPLSVSLSPSPSTPARPTTPSHKQEQDLSASTEIDALLLASPSTPFSAFFGRKSEIAAILHKALSIFEENENELTIFERMESLVEANVASQSNAMSSAVEAIDVMDIDEDPQEINEVEFASLAQQRMLEQIAIARNKCQWEIASVHAVNAAIRRLKKRKNLV